VKEYSLLQKAVLKFKREGIPGVLRAIIKRIYPLLAGFRKRTVDRKAFHILYVVGCNEGESKRYRVYNLMEALAPFNVSAQAVSPEELLFHRVKDFSLVVFFRCEYNRLTAAFLEKCKKAGLTTVFDIDDLIFDESIVGEIDAFNQMDEDGQRLYLLGVKRYRAMLDACDYATASTEYLCRYITQRTGKQAYLITNGLNRTQIQIASSIRRHKPSGRKIGYLSGSNTHRKDFEQAAAALAQILQSYPDVILTIVGFLDIPECLKHLSDRIQVIPFSDYKELLNICADFYTVIIPLEYKTVFCQSKSELKYFEQALLGIPVVASPTVPYAACIMDGKNGFLAANQAEWEEKLTRLLESPDLRNAMGENAAAQIRTQFYPDVIGCQVKQVYDQILLQSTYRRIDKKCLKVSFVIPEPVKGAGGHRNLFRAARAFSQSGHRVTIYTDGFTGRFLSAAALEKFVTENFFETGADFVLGCKNIEPCDLLIATQWKTAYTVKEFRHRCVLPCYFIQDFEPYFYPMGEEYIQAYATYSFDFAQLASGRWAAEMAEKVSGRPCPYFQFPIQREIYKETSQIQREERTVVFFARPCMPRRCYMLGVEAMRLLKERRPDVRIVFFGEDARHYEDYGFFYEKAGMLKGPQELARLYCTATVGVCFSLTNPSLVPYEMMACGLPVVDLDFNGSSVAYGGRDAVFLAGSSPEAICNGVCILLDNPEERARRQQNGKKLTWLMPDEAQMEDFVRNTLIERLFAQIQD